jgi:hypothetical protein
MRVSRLEGVSVIVDLDCIHVTHAQGTIIVSGKRYRVIVSIGILQLRLLIEEMQVHRRNRLASLKVAQDILHP